METDPKIKPVDSIWAISRINRLTTLNQQNNNQQHKEKNGSDPKLFKQMLNSAEEKLEISGTHIDTKI